MRSMKWEAANRRELGLKDGSDPAERWLLSNDAKRAQARRNREAAVARRALTALHAQLRNRPDRILRRALIVERVQVLTSMGLLNQPLTEG